MIPSDSTKVSVIIPLFNGSPYIASCIESVLAQTVKAFEIIVVDDGSTDDSIARVHRLAAQHPGRVTVLQHPDHGNHGIAASRNFGVEHARGEYIAFLDQDDEWLPEKLRLQLDAFHLEPDIALVYGITSYIDADGNPTSLDGFETGGREGPADRTRMFGSLLKQNLLTTNTVLVRRAALQAIGLMHAGQRHEFEDWLAWLKIAFAHRFRFLPVIVAKYRLHGSNFTRERSGGTLHLDAERLLIEDLFTYLLDAFPGESARIQRYLARSIRRWLLRARAYHRPFAELRSMGAQIARVFPRQRGAVRQAMLLSTALPTGLAYALRRLRRRVIKL
jgi:glycosyltransferase involved in cell wall biosynthesis